jgi:hypothetical protein
MKPYPHFDDDPALRSLLHQWTIRTPLPPGFQEQVWRRITLAETRGAPSWWSAGSRLVEGLFLRPTFALAYLAVWLAVGVTAGSLAAQARSQHLKSELSVRYVQSINPYQTEVSRP